MHLFQSIIVMPFNTTRYSKQNTAMHKKLALESAVVAAAGTLSLITESWDLKLKKLLFQRNNLALFFPLVHCLLEWYLWYSYPAYLMKGEDL